MEYALTTEEMDDLGITLLGEDTAELIVKALRYYATRSDVIPTKPGLDRWRAVVLAEAEALDGMEILIRFPEVDWDPYCIHDSRSQRLRSCEACDHPRWGMDPTTPDGRA